MPTPRRNGGTTWAPAEIAAVRRALLAFYDADARTLPWRGETDAYRVWVSEVMLQQTRVETAIPYYERWLGRFPDLAALAAAPLDDVLHAWQGLGYYSRARNLHLAAQVVRERHAGQLPDDTAALRALPGVGEYTAGALASIAYGRAEPAVDGNVRRVLARLRDEPSPTASWLRTAARALVPDERAGDFNQAIMELGATVCVPRNPRCGGCPVAGLCTARARGTQHERPAPAKRAPVPTIRIGTAAVFEEEGRLLLLQRPAGTLLGGMWVLPGEELLAGESGGDAAVRSVTRAIGTAGSFVAGERIGRFRHSFSHRAEIYEVFAFRVGGRERGGGRAATRKAARTAQADDTFVDEAGLDALALARAARRIASAAFAWWRESERSRQQSRNGTSRS
jgi:A/G-specific adenine glycosylase